MKILIQENDDDPRELEEGYASEEELQMFLGDHADLIPVDEIDPGTPPLLCIGYEVYAASGSEDLLYIDKNGLLTIVETKLGRNQEARRAVVGQILEYAAQTAEWTRGDLVSQAQGFLSSDKCPKAYRGQSFEDALRMFIAQSSPSDAEDFSYEEFLDKVERNLERGHIRLIIAIDEPPDPLLKTVEFVNKFSERFEMYLFQLKRFRDKARNLNIFVPALFGRVGEPPSARRTGRQWDREGFLAQARTEAPADRLPILEKLIAFAEEAEIIKWGKGAKSATFDLLLANSDGRFMPLCRVWPTGKVDLFPLPLPKDAVLASYRERLNKTDIPNELIDEVFDKPTFKVFDVIDLQSERSWNAFKEAVLSLKRALEEAR